MKVIVEKDTYGREVASCEYVNGGRQYLQENHVFIRVHDGVVVIGDGQGLREDLTDQEITLARAFPSVKALLPSF